MTHMLRQAVQALNTGKLKAAILIAEDVRKKFPKDGEVLQVLGVAYSQSGNLVTGASYFRKAMQAGLDTPDNRINLARVLMELDQLDEAYSLCISIKNTDIGAMLTLAQIERKRGALTKAEHQYLTILRIDPKNVIALNNLGSLYLEMGQAEKAAEILSLATNTPANSSLTYMNLGRALLAAGQPENACRAFERAAMADRKNPQPLLELSRALNSINHGPSALRAIGAAAQLTPYSADVLIQMGIVFEDIMRPEDAKKAFNAALKMKGGHARSALHLANLYDQSNEVDRIEELLVDLRRISPESGERAYVEAISAYRIKDYIEADQWLSQIENLSINPAVKAQFAARIADKLGKFREATSHLVEMKAHLQSSALASLVDRRGYINELRGYASKLASQQSHRRQLTVEPGVKPLRLVFLVGFPRSGTTLLDTMLMGHSQLHVMEEQPIFSRLTAHLGARDSGDSLSDENVRAIRDRYIAEASTIGGWDGASILIDKNPMLQPKAALIHRIFPEAKFIYAYRHPCDVLLSCYMQSFKPDERMVAFLDINEAADQYDATMAVWQLTQQIAQLQIHDICYEELVHATPQELDKLLKFLDVEWEETALDHRATALNRGHVKTPSYAQIMEPVNTDAIARWEHYRDLLEPIFPILSPWAVTHGYPAIV